MVCSAACTYRQTCHCNFLDALYDLIPYEARQYYMCVNTVIALLQNAFALTLLPMRQAQHLTVTSTAIPPSLHVKQHLGACISVQILTGMCAQVITCCQ